MCAAPTRDAILNATPAGGTSAWGRRWPRSRAKWACGVSSNSFPNAQLAGDGVRRDAPGCFAGGHSYRSGWDRLSQFAAEDMPTPSGTDAFEQFVALLDCDVRRHHGGQVISGPAAWSASPLRSRFTRPEFLVGLSKRNHTYRTARLAAQSKVSNTSRCTCSAGSIANWPICSAARPVTRVDKFRRCSWSEGPEGTADPARRGTAWFAGRVVRRFDLGDHVGHPSRTVGRRRLRQAQRPDRHLFRCQGSGARSRSLNRGC